MHRDLCLLSVVANGPGQEQHVIHQHAKRTTSRVPPPTVSSTEPERRRHSTQLPQPRRTCFSKTNSPNARGKEQPILYYPRKIKTQPARSNMEFSLICTKDNGSMSAVLKGVHNDGVRTSQFPRTAASFRTLRYINEDILTCQGTLLLLLSLLSSIIWRQVIDCSSVNNHVDV